MNNREPVLLSALFTQSNDGYSIPLQLRSNNSESVFVTLLHEHFDGVDSFELSGGEESNEIIAHDGETLTVVVRQEQEIVASGVFEVNSAIAETHGAILSPLTMHNILFDQCDRAIVERAFDDSRDIVVAVKEVEAVLSASLTPAIVESDAEVLA